MNLKEAFRFQNKLSSLIQEAGLVLTDKSNTTQTKHTLFVSKVLKGAEDQVRTIVPASDYTQHITELASFLMFLMGEKEKIYRAVRKAKESLDIDIDSESAMNAKRQDVSSYFQSMNSVRSSQTFLVGEGVAYTFNAEGNQVPVKCDIKKVTTINFDRNKVRSYLDSMRKLTDETSRKLDVALVTTQVEYQAPFDVNASLLDVFEEYLAR